MLPCCSLFPNSVQTLPLLKSFKCHIYTLASQVQAPKPKLVFFVPFVDPALHFPETYRGFSLSYRLTSCADSKLQEKGFHAWLQFVVAETLSNILETRI